jgi:hypothetical protein
MKLGEVRRHCRLKITFREQDDSRANACVIKSKRVTLSLTSNNYVKKTIMEKKRYTSNRVLNNA